FFQKANDLIIEDLQKQGILIKSEIIEHLYPHDMKRYPKNRPTQFLLHTSCSTPYEDYSETEFHSFQLRLTSGRPQMDANVIS
ncbi:MAG: hypothetical protein Q8832_02755, partial [Candidatus Phytoplasma australasiaticum]|nr:hypothetical protein [Candidatus Phytoplasma australasiaticum]